MEYNKIYILCTCQPDKSVSRVCLGVYYAFKMCHLRIKITGTSHLMHFCHVIDIQLKLGMRRFPPDLLANQISC